MKLCLLFFLFVITAASSGCRSHPGKTDKQIETFSQTPAFIKAFLNRLDKGKFLIAEKGEAWAAGCVQMPPLPSRQFISASLHNNQYELVFWQGGFVNTKKKLLIEYNDTVVKSYAFRDL